MFRGNLFLKKLSNSPFRWIHSPENLISEPSEGECVIGCSGAWRVDWLQVFNDMGQFVVIDKLVFSEFDTGKVGQTGLKLRGVGSRSNKV